MHRNHVDTMLAWLGCASGKGHVQWSESSKTSPRMLETRDFSREQYCRESCYRLMMLVLIISETS